MRHLNSFVFNSITICKVFVTGCPSSGRRRRSTSSSQTIILTQTFASGDNLNLEALEDSNNGIVILLSCVNCYLSIYLHSKQSYITYVYIRLNCRFIETLDVVDRFPGRIRSYQWLG